MMRPVGSKEELPLTFLLSILTEACYPFVSLTFFFVLKLHSIGQSLNTGLDVHCFPQGLPFKGSSLTLK